MRHPAALLRGHAHRRPGPAALAALAGPGAGPRAKAIYEGACAGCHGSGRAGRAQVRRRAAMGRAWQGPVDALVKSAIAGTAKGMPPKGGRADLSDAQHNCARHRVHDERRRGRAKARGGRRAGPARRSAPATSRAGGPAPCETGRDCTCGPCGGRRPPRGAQPAASPPRAPRRPAGRAPTSTPSTACSSRWAESTGRRRSRASTTPTTT
jgi:cytochrome c5